MKDETAFKMCLYATALGTLKASGQEKIAKELHDEVREFLTEKEWDDFQLYTQKEGNKILMGILKRSLA